MCFLRNKKTALSPKRRPFFIYFGIGCNPFIFYLKAGSAMSA